MLKEGDRVYISKCDFGEIPNHLIGRQGTIERLNRVKNLYYQWPPGNTWTVSVPPYGFKIFHEAELIKICGRKR